MFVRFVFVRMYHKMKWIVLLQYPPDIQYQFISLHPSTTILDIIERGRVKLYSTMTSLSDIVLGILEEKCYEFYNNTDTTIQTDNETLCGAVFDGLYCWPYTRAGVLAIQPCTNKVIKSTKEVSKKISITIFVLLLAGFSLHRIYSYKQNMFFIYFLF